MGFCEALMATSRVMANQNTIARTLKETHFIWFIFKNMIEKLDRNYLGFCEPLIAPSGVTANQNTNIRTINRIYFYIILIGKYNLKKNIYTGFFYSLRSPTVVVVIQIPLKYKKYEVSLYNLYRKM